MCTRPTMMISHSTLSHNHSNVSPADVKSLYAGACHVDRQSYSNKQDKFSLLGPPDKQKHTTKQWVMTQTVQFVLKIIDIKHYYWSSCVFFKYLQVSIDLSEPLKHISELCFLFQVKCQLSQLSRCLFILTSFCVYLLDLCVWCMCMCAYKLKYIHFY